MKAGKYENADTLASSRDAGGMSDADSIAGYIDEFLHSATAILHAWWWLTLNDVEFAVVLAPLKATSLLLQKTGASFTMLAQALKGSKTVARKS